MSTQPRAIARYDIVDGCNADRLIDAFKYAYVNGGAVAPIQPGFTLECRGATSTKLSKALSVKLTSIGHESGNMASFVIEGYIGLWPVGVKARTRRFRGYYDAASRKGWLETLAD